MNELPPFHVCHTLTAENECIRKKYDQLKRKYKELYKEFLEMKEEMLRVEIEKEYNHLRKDVSLINLNKTKQTKSKIDKKTEEENLKQKNTDEASIKRLVPLYDNLLKRYEAENKQARQQSKKIMKLETEVEKSKDKIFKLEQERTFLHKQLQDKEAMLRNVSSANKNKRSSNYGSNNYISNRMCWTPYTTLIECVGHRCKKRKTKKLSAFGQCPLYRGFINNSEQFCAIAHCLL